MQGLPLSSKLENKHCGRTVVVWVCWNFGTLLYLSFDIMVTVVMVMMLTRVARMAVGLANTVRSHLAASYIQPEMH